MRIIFIGAVAFSACALRELILMGANDVFVCTLRNSSFNADHQDLYSIVEASAIPVCPAAELNTQGGIVWIKRKSPDEIFCFGWSRLAREPFLSLPPLGVIGFNLLLCQQIVADIQLSGHSARPRLNYLNVF